VEKKMKYLVLSTTMVVLLLAFLFILSQQAGWANDSIQSICSINLAEEPNEPNEPEPEPEAFDSNYILMNEGEEPNEPNEPNEPEPECL
jgi:outer membrane biosynthesis protein TonB